VFQSETPSHPIWRPTRTLYVITACVFLVHVLYFR
jgi:hypothetical protein